MGAGDLTKQQKVKWRAGPSSGGPSELRIARVSALIQRAIMLALSDLLKFKSTPLRGGHGRFWLALSPASDRFAAHAKSSWVRSLRHF